MPRGPDVSDVTLVTHAQRASPYGATVGERGTQRKGDIATSRAVATFTAAGCDVALPFTESAAYDLVVDDGAGLHRVQCKYASTMDVDLRRIHSNSKGYVAKRVAVGTYDWLYVLRPGGAEYLVRQCLSGRRSFTPQEEHRIGAVAESGLLQLP